MLGVSHAGYVQHAQNCRHNVSNYTFKALLMSDAEMSKLACLDANGRDASHLNLKLRQYPAIHTNYILYHCTTLNTIILCRSEILNTKNNQVNSGAILALWHASPSREGMAAARPTCPAYGCSEWFDRQDAVFASQF